MIVRKKVAISKTLVALPIRNKALIFGTAAALIVLCRPTLPCCDTGQSPFSREQSSSSSSEGYEGTIVAFGDSLTEGYGLREKDAYPALLEKKLASGGYSYKVVNAGISGETSSGALSRVKWIESLKPDIVVLETGANDAFRGIDPVLIEKNITNVIRTLKDRGIVVVLAGMQITQNLGPSYISAFKGIYPKVAEKEKVILVPFFLAGVAASPKLNQPDGIHPTAEGYRVVTENVYPYVVKAVEKVREMRKSGGTTGGKGT